MISVRRGPVAALLLSSGACALVYQVVWTRELRLVFGASTAASAAVLAIFIGGLGVGGLVLGARADRHRRPLMLYANLEAAVAVAAALTPLFIALARKVYLGLGGVAALGSVGATALRIALSVLVLGIPTFLMGGTLPAAVRAAQADDDPGRRHTALLYGANTLGAVLGSLLATFVAMEVFGARITLWIACLVNLLVAMFARMIARAAGPAPRGPEEARSDEDGSAAPAWFVLACAATVGFVFFLMELVFYRMLAPLLGGSSYTFGLILGVALLGIGAGGLSYALLWGSRRATLAAFAITSLVEAVAIALPFALGDRVALAALGLRSLAAWGFPGLVASWAAVAVVVVLPAALASGFQFPLLIALLGRGRASVGRHLGLTYAWNTLGAIAGSLAGGFGLLPALTATGAWRLVAISLTALGLAAAGLSVVRTRRASQIVGPGILAVAALGLLVAEGPTAAWRHSPIGAGRVALSEVESPFAARGWLAFRRSVVRWQREGREATVALTVGDDRSFVVNGKSDGSFRTDAATQVMFPLVGACLHGNPKTAYVIGLGSGSSAGWLADFPGMSRVDVAEIEPAILEVARDAHALNRGVLDNPKVHLELVDAREGLLTKRRLYDLVASEPSNPYRAGVSSLFTEEYYRAVSDRLAEGGVFLQWMQGYEVDARTVRSIYATVGSVFPVVETWMLDRNDILLVASRRPLAKDAARLRACLAAEPVHEALTRAWETTTLEGFLAHHVARPSFARHLVEIHGDLPLNTDDLNPLEFGVARTVGRAGFGMEDVVVAATRRRERRPEVQGEVDWRLVEVEALSFFPATPPGGFATPPPGAQARVAAVAAATRRSFAEARAILQTASPPVTIDERLVLGFALAALGEEEATRIVDPLRDTHPGEVATILSRLALTRKDGAVAARELEAGLRSVHTSPWVHFWTAQQLFAIAPEIAALQPDRASEIFALVARPTAGGLFEDSRRDALVRLALLTGLDARCGDLAALFERGVPWTRELLQVRARCLSVAGDRRAAAAREEEELFESMTGDVLDPSPPPARSPPSPRAAPSP